MKRQRLLASMGALLLVASAFAVALTPAGADTPSYSGTEWVFLPWVPNGEMLSGTGPWYGTVTVQNLEDETINIATGNTAGSASALTTISPHASKTFTADTLGVGNPGGPLAISATFKTAQYVQVDGEDSDVPIPPKIGAVLKQVSPNQSSSGAATNENHVSVDGHTAIPAQDIAWGPESSFCHDIGGSESDEYCNNLGEYTFGVPEGGFDGHSYLPIVQTNDEWNSVIHVSNIDGGTNPANEAAVTMKFYTTDQQGVFSSELNGIEFTEYLNPGETWTFDLAEQNFPDNWVGSVWIVSDYTVAASVNRVKAETDMVVTNTAAPSIDAITAVDGIGPWSNASMNFQSEASLDEEVDAVEPEFHVGGNASNGKYEMYGPLVFRNYNGWNTGISVVNITEQTNDVDIKFYGTGGGAAIFQDSLTISPKGQDFVYIPNDPALNGDNSFVGSVLLSSDKPFHAAIDQIKYGSGEAVSYIATAAGAEYMGPESPYQESLSLPLVQKGSPITGMGDTSGIQLFNVDPNHTVEVAIEFFNQSGNSSQPTSNAPMTMTLQPYQNATLHTMTFSGMLQNFSGSAVVTPIGGGGQVVGVSNNVNYDVEGDGAAAFNMVNTLGQFRFPHSQTEPVPTSLELEPPEAEVSVDDLHTVTATVYDQYGQPLPNVDVNFDIDDDGTVYDVDPASEQGTTDVNGEVTLTFGNEVAGVTNDIDAWVASSPGVSDSAEVTWLVGEATSVQFIDNTSVPADAGDLPPALLNAFGPYVAGGDETLYVWVTDQFENPVENESVQFSVNALGAPAPDAGSDDTNALGVAEFTYTNNEAVTDTVTATISAGSDNATVEWVWGDPVDIELFIAPLVEPEIQLESHATADLYTHEGSESDRWISTDAVVVNENNVGIPGVQVQFERDAAESHDEHPNDGWCPDLDECVPADSAENPWTATTNDDGLAEGVFARAGSNANFDGELLLRASVVGGGVDPDEKWIEFIGPQV